MLRNYVRFKKQSKLKKGLRLRQSSRQKLRNVKRLLPRSAQMLRNYVRFKKQSKLKKGLRLRQSSRQKLRNVKKSKLSL